MSTFISMDVILHVVLPFLDEIGSIRLSNVSKSCHEYVWKNFLPGRKLRVSNEMKIEYLYDHPNNNKYDVRKTTDECLMRIFDLEIIDIEIFLRKLGEGSHDNSLFLLEDQYPKTLGYVRNNLSKDRILFNVKKTVCVNHLKYICENNIGYGRFLRHRYHEILKSKRHEKFFFIFTLLRIITGKVMFRDDQNQMIRSKSMRKSGNSRLRTKGMFNNNTRWKWHGITPVLNLPFDYTIVISSRNCRLSILCIRFYLETLPDGEERNELLKEGLNMVFSVYPIYTPLNAISKYTHYFRGTDLFIVGFHHIIDLILNKFCTKEEEKEEEGTQTNQRVGKNIFFKSEMEKYFPQYMIRNRWRDRIPLLFLKYVSLKALENPKCTLEIEKTLNSVEFLKTCVHFGDLDIVKFISTSSSSSVDSFQKNIQQLFFREDTEEKEKSDGEVTNILDCIVDYWKSCSCVDTSQRRVQTYETLHYLLDTYITSDDEGKIIVFFSKTYHKQQKQHTQIFKTCFLSKLAGLEGSNRLRIFDQNLEKIDEESLQFFVNRMNDPDILSVLLQCRNILPLRPNEQVFEGWMNRFLLNWFSKIFSTHAFERSYRFGCLLVIVKNEFMGFNKEVESEIVELLKSLIDHERRFLAMKITYYERKMTSKEEQTSVMLLMKYLEKKMRSYTEIIRVLFEREDFRDLLKTTNMFRDEITNYFTMVCPRCRGKKDHTINIFTLLYCELLGKEGFLLSKEKSDEIMISVDFCFALEPIKKKFQEALRVSSRVVE